MPGGSAFTNAGVQRDGPSTAGPFGAVEMVGSDGALIELTLADYDWSLLPENDPLIFGRMWWDRVSTMPSISLGTTPYTPSLDFSDSRNSMYKLLMGLG